MVWGCIAYDMKGPLVLILKDRRKGANYVDLIMTGPLWDFYEELMRRGALHWSWEMVHRFTNAMW